MNYFFKLLTDEPYLIQTPAVDVDFTEIARNLITREDGDEVFLEMVTPRLLGGKYGFFMDEYAVRYQKELNRVATVIYNYPDPVNEYWHAITGNAVVGKVVYDQDACGYTLDYLSEEEASEAFGLIKKALDSIKGGTHNV